EAIDQLSRGVHPREAADEARREQAKLRANTFAGVAEDHIRLHAARLRSGAPLASLIRRHLVARWGDRPLAGITRRDVIAALDELVAAGQPAAARKTLSAARALFNWAI